MKTKTLFIFACLLTCFIPVLAYGQVQTFPYQNPNVQFFDNIGSPCAGCTLSTFAAGTTNALATYSDSAGTVPNANPLTLDSAGRATIYMTSASYKFVLKSALGVTLVTQDNISAANLASTLTSLTVNGTTQIIPSTAATSGANQSGPLTEMCGNYWTGTVSAADCWNWQDVLGTGTNPTSTFTLTHSGSSGTASIALPTGVAINGVTLAGSGALSGVSKLDNRIYVDGVKYTLDRTGIAAAIADACAMTGGVTNGTVVYLPPMNITVATGFTVTAPISIIGAGIGRTAITATTGPVFTLSPSANFSQNQEWEIAHGYWIATSGDVIKFNDSNGFPVDHLRIHDNEFNSGSATGWAINYPSTVANGGFDWKIERNYFFVGISITSDSSLHGLADGLLIAENQFDNASTTTNPAMHLDSLSGAAQWTVFHNRGGFNGGFLESTGTGQLKILYNQIEQTAGSGTANSAIIDLQGTTFTIDGAEIRGNNINAHNQASINIRLDHASNTTVEGNVISLKTGGSGSGITLTANASATRIPWNEYVLSGGTAVTNASATTNFAIQAPDGTKGAPAYSFLNATNAGWYHRSSVYEFSFAGTPVIQVGSSQTVFDAGVAFANGATDTTSPTANLSWIASGVVGVGNGTFGNVTGEIRSAKISATYDHSGNVQTAVHIVQDTVTLSAGSATVTLAGSAVFTSASSYTCIAIDETAANAVKVTQTSGTSITFTGTSTDVIRYICIGN